MMIEIPQHTTNLISVMAKVDKPDLMVEILAKTGYVAGDIFYDNKNQVVVIIKRGRINSRVYIGTVSNSKGYVDTIQNTEIESVIAEYSYVGNDRSMINLNRYYHDRNKIKAQRAKQ